MATLEHALAYMLKGWSIMPCHTITEDKICSCPDRGCKRPGKHSRLEHGSKESSKHLSQAHLWWSMWPDSNIQVATGWRSGFITLDVDAKSGGFESLAQLERRFGTLPKTVTVITGGGGRHFYFKYPGFEVRGRIGMRPGLDVQADDMQTVAPPSKHKSGFTYRWEEGKSPDEVQIASLPRWLLGIIQTKNPPKKKIKRAFY